MPYEFIPILLGQTSHGNIRMYVCIRPKRKRLADFAQLYGISDCDGRQTGIFQTKSKKERLKCISI